jgi:hypothetical protein
VVYSFLYTTKNLGVPGSSRGTLECNRVDLTIYCTLGGGDGGGGQREGTVEGQQYTSIVPSSMGGNSSQAGSKIQTMSECISSL